MISVNEDFSNKSKRIKMNVLTRKEIVKVKLIMIQKENNDGTVGKVLQERQYLLDASIVRILKFKKSIKHSLLIEEIFNDLKLPFSVKNNKANKLGGGCEKKDRIFDKQRLHLKR